MQQQSLQPQGKIQSHTIIQDGRTFCFKAGSTTRSEKVTQCFTQTRLENLHIWRWYTFPRTQVPRPEHPCEGQASPHIQSDPLLTPLMSAVSCLPCTAVNCRSVCEALRLRVRCGMEERWQEQDGRFRALCKVSIMANPAHSTLCVHSESVGVLGSLLLWQGKEVTHRGKACLGGSTIHSTSYPLNVSASSFTSCVLTNAFPQFPLKRRESCSPQKH